jgi:putative transposase
MPMDAIMTYDPNCHHRQSIRLHGYDYTQPGAYFVTICTHERQLLFDSPALRRIAEQQWRRIANERVTLDAWVVMSDHVHGIIMITEGAQPELIGAALVDNNDHRPFSINVKL